MATISLYASKINNMPVLIKDVKKSVTNYKSELTNLKNKSYNVNKSICDLDGVISTISTSTQTQEDKIEALETFHNNCEQFITDTVKIDSDVADIVNQNKEDFYNKYYYLKPECEKSGWEKFCDGCKKVGEWCKDNWKSIVKIVVAVVIIAALGIASVLTGGALAVILAGAFWGALIGGALGGIMGGITSVMGGGSFLEGFADGALSGTVTGAITGAACAGIGLAGQAFGIVSNGIVEGNKYTLPEFIKDGVYAVELTAVDVAGNESVLNLNTYARMINQDVLAFIMDSNLEKKTGLYSFEYENGQAISKKPSSFEDLKIYVMAKKDTPIDIVMRDANGKEILTNAQCTIDDSIYGIGIYNYLLKADFFKENFQDDVDIELILSVNNEGHRIDLGKMHIDNIVPTCDISEDLSSWHWFFGEDERTFTLSNISELVNESQCKVYDNGNAIPFVYSDVENTITFKLSKGWHNVGFVLVDMAGNTNNIQEKTNIHIGYFWLWIIISVAVLIITTTVCVVIHNRNRKKREIEAI